MNYNSVILCGVITLVTIWWFVHAVRKYEGPDVKMMVEINSLDRGRRKSEV
jgi:hypothetical protein